MDRNIIYGKYRRKFDNTFIRKWALIIDHFRVIHSIIVRLMQRFRQTVNVTDRPCAGRPRKTTPREDRLISRRARRRPFSTAGAFRGNLAFGDHISTHTVIRRLHHQGIGSQWPIKRPQLTLHQFDWSHDHLGWTIRTWRRVHWSDESRFCYALPTVVQGFGANETLHFRTTTFWAQLRSMTRCVTELHNKRGGYTRYWFLCLTHTHNRCI